MFRITKFRYLFPALIALGTVIYGVVVSTVNTRHNLRDTERVARSRQVLSSLKDVQRQMLDLETGARGYVIVGEPEYLEPYERALARVDVELRKLMDLTRDSPAQQARIGLFKEVMNEARESMEAAVETRKASGLEAAAAELKNGGGKEQMDRLRTLTDQMHQDELILLLKREDKLQRTLGRTNLTVSVAGLVAIAAGILGTTLLFLFLSSQERAERLKQEKEKAMEADRAKSDFLTMMSHEIRTPMNAILGFSELLHDRAATPQDKHFAGAILSSGNSLLTLINDILDLSKIEAGKIDIQEETVSMSAFCENLETLFSFRCAEKELEYTVRFAPNVPQFLSFDASRLRQVLVNLVGNAIKFTEEGSVTVFMHADDATTDDVVVLHIEVLDTGIGIPAGQLDEIFRPFYQVDSRRDRRFQGTGLGLGISRRLVEVMDGTITVESGIGRGSLFRVSIPTRLSHHPEPGSESAGDSVAVDRRVSFGGDSLEAPKGRCWPELCRKLDDLQEAVWPELVKIVPAKGSIKFGELLVELADQHSCPPLAAYARQLMTAAEMMDFPEAGRMLQMFPALVAQLRSPQ